MSVIVLQVFVSLMLVLGSLLLFLLSVKLRDAEHADRLSLFPLDDDATRSATPAVPTIGEPPVKE